MPSQKYGILYFMILSYCDRQNAPWGSIIKDKLKDRSTLELDTVAFSWSKKANHRWRGWENGVSST